MAITDKQREFRLSGIGGSDAGAILRVSPFQEPYTLYLEKIGELEPEDISGQPQVRWGHLLEEPVAQAYVEKTGRKVQRDNRSYRHKQHSFMIAHLDRKVVGEKRGLECKTSAFGVGWGQAGTNEIPPYVYAQVQHYLKVREFDQWDVACLVGGNDLRIYEIGRDDEFIARLVEAEEEFWDRVEARVPPQPTWEHSELIATLQRMFPGTNGSVVQLPEVAQKYFDVMEDAKNVVKTYSTVIDGCKARIQMLMGEASVALLPDGSCFTRKEVKRKGYTVDEATYLNFTHTKRVPKVAQDAIDSGDVEPVGPSLLDQPEASNE